MTRKRKKDRSDRMAYDPKMMKTVRVNCLRCKRDDTIEALPGDQDEGLCDECFQVVQDELRRQPLSAREIIRALELRRFNTPHTRIN